MPFRARLKKKNIDLHLDIQVWNALNEKSTGRCGWAANPATNSAGFRIQSQSGFGWSTGAKFGCLAFDLAGHTFQLGTNRLVPIGCVLKSLPMLLKPKLSRQFVVAASPDF